MVMLQRWPVQWSENGLRGGQFNGVKNGHVTEVDSNRGSMIVKEEVKLMEGEWSCYGGGQVEGEWSCYRGGHCNEGGMVMLQKSPV